MSGVSKTTTDHHEIKQWVEEHGGKPAAVKGTSFQDDPGLLRINFREYDSDNLDEITWDDFFKKFDEKQLAFMYTEEAESAEPNYFKLVMKE